MRSLSMIFGLIAGLAIIAGCERRATIEGPTVNKFTGKLIAQGKPLTLTAGDKASLKLFHHSGQSFGIPIQTDGTFNIGEMPIGKYSGQLVIEKDPLASSDGKPVKKAPSKMVPLPDGFEIKEGQTEYTVDFGDRYKP